MPTNSGCRGTVITQHDIQHKFLGPVRLFLTVTDKGGFSQTGCIAAVTASAKVLPAIQIDTSDNYFGFPSTATDATGNTFVSYNPGRYNGVAVLIPTADGFEDIGLDYTGYTGRHAYYYAEVVGPGPKGQYTIRQSRNDCTPNCAGGTITNQDLHWNGSDYVA